MEIFSVLEVTVMH